MALVSCWSKFGSECVTAHLFFSFIKHSLYKIGKLVKKGFFFYQYMLRLVYNMETLYAYTETFPAWSISISDEKTCFLLGPCWLQHNSTLSSQLLAIIRPVTKLPVEPPGLLSACCVIYLFTYVYFYHYIQ